MTTVGAPALVGIAPAVHAHAGHGVTTSGWLLPLLVLVLLGGAYLAGAVRWGRRRGRPWRRARTAAWLTGSLLVAAALSPLPEVLVGGAPAHVVRHLLLGMLGPLGLVLGAPVSLLLAVMPVPARRPAARVLRSRPLRVLSHPAVAAVLDMGGLVVLHTTPLHALALREPVVEALVGVHVLAAGCLFTWAVVGGPDPAPHRPGTRTRVVVLVLASAVHGVLAKTLYARAGELPPGAGYGVEEARAAARWLYHGGDVAEVLLAAALLAAWYRARGRRRAVRPAGAASLVTARWGRPTTPAGRAAPDG